MRGDGGGGGGGWDPKGCGPKDKTFPMKVCVFPTMVALVWGGGRLGWGGSRLAPKAVPHGQCDLTSPPAFGRLVSQPPKLLTIPELHQGAGEREIPPCL